MRIARRGQLLWGLSMRKNLLGLSCNRRMAVCMTLSCPHDANRDLELTFGTFVADPETGSEAGMFMTME